MNFDEFGVFGLTFYVLLFLKKSKAKPNDPAFSRLKVVFP
jgi:hypothetical protein